MSCRSSRQRAVVPALLQLVAARLARRGGHGGVAALDAGGEDEALGGGVRPHPRPVVLGSHRGGPPVALAGCPLPGCPLPGCPLPGCPAARPARRERGAARRRTGYGLPKQGPGHGGGSRGPPAASRCAAERCPHPIWSGSDFAPQAKAPPPGTGQTRASRCAHQTAAPSHPAGRRQEWRSALLRRKLAPGAWRAATGAAWGTRIVHPRAMASPSAIRPRSGLAGEGPVDRGDGLPEALPAGRLPGQGVGAGGVRG